MSEHCIGCGAPTFCGRYAPSSPPEPPEVAFVAEMVRRAGYKDFRERIATECRNCEIRQSCWGAATNQFPEHVDCVRFSRLWRAWQARTPAPSE